MSVDLETDEEFFARVRRMCENTGTHLGLSDMSGIDYWAFDGKLFGFVNEGLTFTMQPGDDSEQCDTFPDALGGLPWESNQHAESLPS